MSQRIKTIRLASGESQPAVPFTPSLSSAEIGWQDVIAERHRLPPIETPQIANSNHLICLHLGPSVKLERQVADGRFQSKSIRYGEYNFTPCNLPIQIRCQEQAEIMFVAIAPSVIERVASGSIYADRIQFTERWLAPDPLIAQLAMELKAELERGGVMGQLYVDSLSTVLGARLLRYYSTSEQPLQDVTGKMGTSQLREVIEYIHDNLAEDLSLVRLAEVANLTVYQFARLFKRTTGQTPHQYVIQCRIERAKLLLEETQLPISDIAYRVGFANQSHFSTLFRRSIGVTPKAYREML